jgi:FdhD protein
MEVRVNGASFAVIMRTPGADRDLAAGFLLAEDVIRDAHELATIEYCQDADEEARDNTLNVTVIDDAVERLRERLGERRQVMMTASCGLCGRRTIESLRSRAAAVVGQWTVSADLMHAAGLFALDGRLTMLAEDVGRHNAVDKVVGRRLLEDALPLDQSLLMVSGRTSFELVQKALLAGVPLIAAVSAPSSLAIELAEQAGVTLCGFLRGDTFNVYAHPQRIV